MDHLIVFLEDISGHYLFSWKNILLKISFITLLVGISTCTPSHGTSLDADVEVREYCLNHDNVFNATCPSDHVIVMRVARYGRMRVGKCMQSERELGCYADVIRQMHARCSGRARCTVIIPDRELHELYPCDKEIAPYLEAGYECVKVTTATDCKAMGNSQLEIEEFPGYLSSLVARPSDRIQPNGRCKIRLHGPAGTTIRLTLHDFGGNAQENTPSTNDCIIYANIRDPKGGPDNLVCAGLTGKREVMTSIGNDVIIEIPVVETEAERPHFLLHYESMGCADPPVPEGALMSRHGNSATITCNVTSHTWHIICKQSSWVGVVHNCSKNADKSQLDVRGAHHNSPRWSLGLLVAVLIGVLIGVALGMACLFAVTCFLKKGKKENRRYEHTMNTVPHEQVHMLPHDHGYECARMQQNSQIPTYDSSIDCPYHSLRHKDSKQDFLKTYEKPSIIQDCETCVDHAIPDGNTQCAHSPRMSYSQRTPQPTRYLPQDVIPYNLNECTFKSS